MTVFEATPLTTAYTNCNGYYMGGLALNLTKKLGIFALIYVLIVDYLTKLEVFQ